MSELTFNFRSGTFNPSFSQNEFILFTKKKKKKRKKRKRTTKQKKTERKRKEIKDKNKGE